MSNIELKNITKKYGDKTVIDNLTLSFPKGETTCIMGPSGCGKTTLLRILASLETPDSGEITGAEGSVSFVFQEDRLCEDFSVLSNIRLVTGKNCSKEKILSHIKELGLEDYSDTAVSKLSGGMKRRVAIARGICFDADIVIMDEPFKGLDETLKKTVMDYVKKHTENKTLICVTHDRSEAEYLGVNIIFSGEENG